MLARLTISVALAFSWSVGVNALPQASRNEIGVPVNMPQGSLLKDSDMFCIYNFASWFLEFYGQTEQALVWARQVYSTGAAPYGNDGMSASFYCQEGPRIVPPGQVRSRGPYILTCDEDDHETLEFYRTEEQPKDRKVRCIFDGDDDEKGDRPDTKLMLSSIKSKLVNSGLTDCVATTQLYDGWLQLGYAVWASDGSGTNRNGETLPVSAFDLSWAQVGAPIDTILHEKHFQYQTFFTTVKNAGKSYRACAYNPPGSPSRYLNMLSMTSRP